MSIKKFIDYLEYEKIYSTHTLRAYKNDLVSFQKFIFNNYGETDLLKIHYGQIRSWIVSLVKLGISNRSINRKMSSLKSFYTFFEKTQSITTNPIRGHKSLKIEKKIIVPFSKKELNEVKKISNKTGLFEELRDELLIELLYTTGMRRAELINLKITDIDFFNNTVKVLGKRNKERFIPLLPSTKILLEAYLIKRKEQATKVSSLFITKKGKQIYASMVYKIIHTYFETITTKEKKSPHVLRHSFATHLLDEGADLNIVKELLGHASLASTQVYTHSSLSYLKEVYKKSHPRNKS